MRRSIASAVLLLAWGMLAAQTRNPADSSKEFDRLAILAARARDAGRIDEAIRLYTQATGLRAQWTEGWWYLGTLLYDRDSYEAAARAFQRAAALDSTAGNSLVMLGLSEAKLGRRQEALLHIEQGGRLGIGDDPQLRQVMLYNLGLLLLENGDFEKAQQRLDTLARDGVESNEVIMALGMSALGIMPGKLSGAGAAENEMVRRAGWAEHFAAQRSRLNEALREYERLAADYPGTHNVQFALGRFLLANHYDERAAEAFRREIENSPSHLLARLGIAALKEKSDPPAGLPYAEEAVRMYPLVAEGHYLLGALLLDTGQVARAIAELETAKQTTPEDARIYFALGRAYARANRPEEAERARATFARLNEQAQ